VWWWRQRTNDQGLGTWFQPSVDIQRKGVKPEQLGADPVILPGDVLHCDVGITVARLNTDTQHDAYVLLPGETDAPAGLKKALANANAMQDIAMEETRPGRTGNEILASVRQRMKAKGIDGTMYSHPIGVNGHGAGPLIGLWDYQDGVPGRGDAKVVPSMWFSVELQATTPVPEWGGQPVRMAQEEDMIVGANGKTRWALRRQDRLFLVGSKGEAAARCTRGPVVIRSEPPASARTACKSRLPVDPSPRASGLPCAWRQTSCIRADRGTRRTDRPRTGRPPPSSPLRRRPPPA
jgi:Xaa-Pro aminopeptidase